MTKCGKKVLVIDKAGHVGGNCRTERIAGIDVHLHGPHIFHTNSDRVWQYVNQYARFNHFVNRPKVNYRGRVYSFPINLLTLYQLWGVATPAEAMRKVAEVRVPIEHPANMEEWILANLGEEVYQTFFYGYTKKQWRREPRELPASIIKRLPVRYTYDDNYYTHTHQGIPVGGYTSIFERQLDGVEVKLGTTLDDVGDWRAIARHLVYTGRPEELLDYRYGELEYLTLRFEHHETTGDLQGNAIINYTEEAVPYTRSVEHKHFAFKQCDETVVTKEYPVDWTPRAAPYYPINTDANNALYQRYKKEITAGGDITLGGRLGRYQYLDMDQVIGSALVEAEKYR
jgi:UDP-galactopyranose mutase